MVRRRWPIVGFAGWTAYVWTTRIVNAWTSSDEATSAKVLSTVLASVLLAGAVSILVVAVRARARALTGREAGLVRAVAGVTLLAWLVRVPQILLDAGHDVPFKVVHLVLALVSLVLAGLAWRAATPSAPAGTSGTDGTGDVGHGITEPAADRVVSPAANTGR